MIRRIDLQHYFSPEVYEVTENDYMQLFEKFSSGGFARDVEDDLAAAFIGYMYAEPGDETAKYAEKCKEILSS